MTALCFTAAANAHSINLYLTLISSKLQTNELHWTDETRTLSLTSVTALIDIGTDQRSIGKVPHFLGDSLCHGKITSAKT